MLFHPGINGEIPFASAIESSNPVIFTDFNSLSVDSSQKPFIEFISPFWQGAHKGRTVSNAQALPIASSASAIWKLTASKVSETASGSKIMQTGTLGEGMK